MIKEKYGVEKLQLSKFSDGKAYTKSELLGKNFPEIDAALTDIFLTKDNITINYDKSSVFISRIISTLSAISEKEIKYRKKNADITVPKAKNKFIDIIIHNDFVYKIGLILFKKGSRARNFLKRHL